jgi:hypothetical protein
MFDEFQCAIGGGYNIDGAGFPAVTSFFRRHYVSTNDPYTSLSQNFSL